MFLTAEQLRFVRLTMDLQDFILFCRVDDFWAFVHMDLNVNSCVSFCL